MSDVVNKFLTYIAVDTQSEEGRKKVPSTEKQFELAKLLAKELRQLGAEDVRLDEHCYVYASIPSTSHREVPSLGFVAHMDTSPAYPAAGVKPVIVRNYQGGDIPMNEETKLAMSSQKFPELFDYVGKDLITTDGTTLLGADDKAGVAEIMAMAEYFLENPQIPHGKIQIGFTPDEEVGRGADYFDVEHFGADVAYTVDGGALGELEFENFNAASAKVTIHGFSIHPGSAKKTMINSILIGYELQSMLPVFDNPMYTEGYEGFYHLDGISGNVEETHLNYIIRDHDRKTFESRKALMQRAVSYLNEKYGEGTCELHLSDSYYNMREKIEPHRYLIDIAEAAMADAGVAAKISPIRGGTDGARLSYMGLPCPNLSTGGHNFHGKYEFVCIQSMEKMVEVLIGIAKKIEQMDLPA